MRAIVEAAHAGVLAAEPRLVVSNNRKAPALEFAAERGVPSLVIATQADPDAADQALCAALEAAGVE
ncbi:MAG: phosphoribosylglycinamide formyltransferase, partial [Phenylobacterium sp.]